jgi:hypothetical protein
MFVLVLLNTPSLKSWIHKCILQQLSYGVAATDLIQRCPLPLTIRCYDNYGNGLPARIGVTLSYVNESLPFACHIIKATPRRGTSVIFSNEWKERKLTLLSGPVQMKQQWIQFGGRSSPPTVHWCSLWKALQCSMVMLCKRERDVFFHLIGTQSVTPEILTAWTIFCWSSSK